MNAATVILMRDIGCDVGVFVIGVVAVLLVAGQATSQVRLRPDEVEQFYENLRDARRAHAAGQMPAARAKIRAARSLAGRVQETQARGEWLVNVVTTQIEIEDVAAAAEIAGYIRADEPRFRARCAVAAAQYARRQLDAGAAMVTALLKETGGAGPEAVASLIEVARAAQKAGQIDSARQIAASATGEIKRYRANEAARDAFETVGVFLVELGCSDDARELVDAYPRTSSDTRRNEAMAVLYSRLLQAEATRGRDKQAAKALTKVTELLSRMSGRGSTDAVGTIIDALMAAGRLDEAKELAASFRDPADEAEARLQIARRLIASGKKDPAVEMLEKAGGIGRDITDARQQQQVLLSVVRALNELKLYNRASPVAAAIRQPQHRAMAYWQIAEAQMAAEEVDAAMETYRWARDAIRSDKKDWRRELAWKHLMLSMKRSGLDDLAATWQRQMH